MNAFLPSFFKHKRPSDLVRIGRAYDGGYTISKKDIIETSHLISLGMDDDWSFELGFKFINEVPISIYDGSISKRFFLKRMIRSILRVEKQFILLKSIKTYLSYISFFQDEVKHIEKNVGLDLAGSITMDNVFKETDSNKIFLKIDIEGGEYRLLDSIIENQNRLTGMVMEFHDCDLHIALIENFLSKFSLSLVNIHANNCGPIDDRTGLPVALELSFSSQAVASNEFCSYPNSIDQTNNPFEDEIILNFSD
jgi:hypothetical protein